MDKKTRAACIDVLNDFRTTFADTADNHIRCICNDIKNGTHLKNPEHHLDMARDVLNSKLICADTISSEDELHKKLSSVMLMILQPRILKLCSIQHERTIEAARRNDLNQLPTAVTFGFSVIQNGMTCAVALFAILARDSNKEPRLSANYAKLCVFILTLSIKLVDSILGEYDPKLACAIDKEFADVRATLKSQQLC